MKLISSDTNVWIDFLTIDRLDLPFKLPLIYLMNHEAIYNELVEPKGLSKKLLDLGLQGTELFEEEFFLAEVYRQRYQKLSVFDSIALAIAKHRVIPLLTGDGALRKAAKKEGVEVIGTIKLLDMLFENQIVDQIEYVECLRLFLTHNGGFIRLPTEELLKRIDQLE